MTNHQNLTTRQARSAARSLVSWGASNVRVVEAFHPDGSSSLIVAYDNRCGMPRSVQTMADLVEVREAMA